MAAPLRPRRPVEHLRIRALGVSGLRGLGLKGLGCRGLRVKRSGFKGFGA